MFHYYSLGGDTTALSGLGFNCHAFLVPSIGLFSGHPKSQGNSTVRV